MWRKKKWLFFGIQETPREGCFHPWNQAFFYSPQCTKDIDFYFHLHGFKKKGGGGRGQISKLPPLPFSVAVFFFFLYFPIRAFAIAIVFSWSWRNTKNPEIFVFLLVLKIGQKNFSRRREVSSWGEWSKKICDLRVIPSPAQVILQLNFPDTKTSKTMENFINPPSLRVSLCCLIKQMYKREASVIWDFILILIIFNSLPLKVELTRAVTPSITGGTVHLQQTAGLRSERECWGNFLSRQAGLRMILSTVDTPLRPPLRGGLQGGGEKSLSLFFFFFFPLFLFIYLFIQGFAPVGRSPGAK